MEATCTTSLAATSKLLLKQCSLISSIKERLSKLKHVNVTFVGPHLSEMMQSSSAACATPRQSIAL